MKETYCRIDGVIARGANKAVIFRRGPSKVTQMLLWDFSSDVVTPGQWLKAKVHTSDVLVSDDAKFVAYMAADYRYKAKRKFGFWPEHLRGNLYRWIAVSHPPYFTAIGLWQPFFSIGKLEAPTQGNSHTGIQLPQVAIELATQIFNPKFSSQLERDGWTSQNTSEQLKNFNNWRNRLNPAETLTYRKDFGCGHLLYQITQNRRKITITNSVTIFDKESVEIMTIQAEPTHPLWIDIDNFGRVVYANKGCLWAWANFPEGEPQLIADLNPNTFEEVAPPDWATKP
ncbi:MAG: hypothetical protein KF824_08670 [Fimbriimonadaceae bacterium]|nr:MAG: hypothetical protein KF824_08670 [Fimbriimonadaceae bacterium]